MSVFYWMQIYHFWECLRMLELVKYHWEPSAFVKMIVCTSGLLLLLKQQMAPALMFLGSPLVMVFMYMYAREYGVQMTNFMGFFQIQCGWLPFAQMLQDLAQTGDIMPNLIGLLAGHTYYYAAEVAPRLVMPDELPSLGAFLEGVVLSHKRNRRADADASESADVGDGGDAERRVEEAQGEVSGGEDSALDAPDDAALAAADNEGVASVRAGGGEVPEREHVGVSAVEAAADVDDESLADL
jgi:Derlin-2/3